MLPSTVEKLPPEENMRRDEEALLSVESGQNSCLWRIYRWDRLCLSLGRHQVPPRNLSLPVVKRPTGGGALLHGWDVSFSVAALRESWGAKPRRIYLRIALLIAESFRDLGIDVSVVRSSGGYRGAFFCFSTPSPGELTWRGRKIAAVAMRTLRRAFLIQGSVYLHFDYALASQLTGASEEVLRGRIVSLEEVSAGGKFVSVLRKKLSRLTPVCPDRRAGL